MQPHELDRILTRMLEAHGPVSDLNFTANKPPQVELNGQLVPVTGDPPVERLTPFQTEAVALALLGSDRRLTETFVRTGSCDLSYALGTTVRFRVNIFQQRGQTSVVLRRLASEVPTIEGMGLPPVIRKLSEVRDGMILVTGATGCGKSTTLAAVLDIVNETKAVHVVTLGENVEKAYWPGTRLPNYPEAVYIIVSLMDRAAPVVKGYTINEGAVQETTVSVL